jgi:aminomethyltransferase
MTPFAGWDMPLRYSSERAEHVAVRAGCGLFDLSHMAELDVTGVGAAALLDGALVSDISGMDVGRARYTMMCEDDGGVVDDLVVYRLADDHFFVVANAANRLEVARRLAAAAEARADVAVSDETMSWALVAVQGPASPALTATVVAEPIGDLRYYRAMPADINGVPGLVARTGYTGEVGYELYVPADAATELWDRLLASGDAQPIGLAARDSLRLEAGMPLYGHELDRTTTPYDAGLGQVVALGKQTPFVGQEALAARAQAMPTRQLVGLVSDGRRPLRAGHPVVLPGGAEVGVVTSGVRSPTLDETIAMAYVIPDAAAVDTRLHVDTERSTEQVRVVALPFYKRPK